MFGGGRGGDGAVDLQRAHRDLPQDRQLVRGRGASRRAAGHPVLRQVSDRLGEGGRRGSQGGNLAQNGAALQQAK